MRSTVIDRLSEEHRARAAPSQPVLLSFERVMDEFRHASSRSDAQTDWARHLLQLADRQLGAWELQYIPATHALDILLPHHKHGELELVPPRGSSVLDATARRRSFLTDYARVCQRCNQTIERFRDAPIGTLFLSREPVTAMYEYATMAWAGQLVHMDGLHRLIAVAHHRRFDQPLRCVIARRHTNSDRA